MFVNPGSFLIESEQLFIVSTLNQRWSTTLSSKVKFSHAFDSRSFCRANLVTQPSKSSGSETLDFEHVDPQPLQFERRKKRALRWIKELEDRLQNGEQVPSPASLLPFTVI